jgi:hypothetical protein
VKNDYEIRGHITVIYLNSPKYGKFEAIIDTESFKIVDSINGTWLPSRDGKSGAMYARFGYYENGKRKTKHMHRLVMNAPSGLMVDHKNHNTLDNRKINLRIVTSGQNQQNLRGARSNNKSTGIRGVFKNGEAYSVYVAHKYLGSYRTIEEAEEVAKQGRARLLPYSKEASEIGITNRVLYDRNNALIANKTSLVRNVTWNEGKKQWIVQFQRDHKKINIGGYKNFEDAARIANEVRERIERGEPIEDLKTGGGRICRATRSGIRGVHWDNRMNAWVIVLKKKYYGSFAKLEDAKRRVEELRNQIKEMA